MATETTKILVRNTDGSPALWLDIVDTMSDAGITTLNDENTSILFNPETEDLDAAVAQWEAATA